jgi:hypothetical protein
MKRGVMIFGGLVGCLFIAFVWPTMYRYDTSQIDFTPNAPAMLTRTNRFTGNCQLLYIYGWIDIRPPRTETTKSVEPPKREEWPDDPSVKFPTTRQ